MKALLVVGLVACTPNDSPPRRPEPSPQPEASTAAVAPVPADAHAAQTVIDAGTGARAMTPKTCEEAKQAIESRRFVGWRGLPAGCSPDAMFGVKFEAKEWPKRTLGKHETRWHGLDIPGYYEPTVSVRDGVVVLFDGMSPELDGDWAPLAADLGEPEAKLDWTHDMLQMKGGEWIYPQRGITIFGRASGNAAIRIAVYHPTTLADYKASLRPDYGGLKLRERP
jgi:hypothetical protein